MSVSPPTDVIAHRTDYKISGLVFYMFSLLQQSAAKMGHSAKLAVIVFFILSLCYSHATHESG